MKRLQTTRSESRKSFTPDLSTKEGRASAVQYLNQFGKTGANGEKDHLAFVSSSEERGELADGGSNTTNPDVPVKQYFEDSGNGRDPSHGNGAGQGGRGVGGGNSGRNGDGGGRNNLGGGRVTDSGTQFGGGMSTGGAGLGQSGFGTGGGVDNAAATASRQPGSDIGRGNVFGRGGNGGASSGADLLSGDWSTSLSGMTPQIQRKAQNVDPNAPLTSNQIGPDERLGLNSGESQASYDHRARAAGLSSKGTNSIGDRLADFAANPTSANTEDPVFNGFMSLMGGVVPGLNAGLAATNLARALTGDNGSPPTDTNPDTGNKRELVAADILAGDPETATDQAPVDDGIYSDVRLQDRRRAGTPQGGNGATLDDRLDGTAAAALDTPQARFIPRKRLVSLAA